MSSRPARPLRRVLLTGAAGFIGSHLAERLLAEGCEVVGFDHFEPPEARQAKHDHLFVAAAHPAFRCVQADLRDRAAIERTLVEHGPFDAVAHLAARAGVRASFADPDGYADVNVGGTRALLEALDARGSTASLVFASSSSVYGASTAPFREDHPLGEPLSPYAASKQACERLLESAHRASGRAMRVLRLFTVYGPRQRPDMALRRFGTSLLRGQPVALYGDGASRRDYSYVDDVVDGWMRALTAERDWRIYNLGSGSPVRLDVTLALLAGALGCAPRAEHEPAQRGDAPLTWAANERARTELGWEPRVRFEDGVRRTAAWLRREHESQTREGGA